MKTARRLAGLDGRLAGQAFPLDRDLTTLGTHAACDLALSPAEHPAVAERHAAIIREDAGWAVRDLDSPAGTRVNGVRIRRERRLNPGDTIQLGEDGPRLRFEVASGPDPALRRARRWRVALRTLAAGVVGMTAYLAWHAVARPDERARQRAELLARVDSLTGVLLAAEARESTLAVRLAEAARDADATRRQLAAVAVGDVGMDSLARVVDALQRDQAALVRATEFDLVAVTAAHRQAVALLLVERQDGTAITGTAVAVRSSGDTTWVLTSRHLVVDSAGRVPRRIGLAFDGTAQVFEALLVRSDPDHDLAQLRLAVRGGTPAVTAMGPTPPPGSPVAVITFPLGLELASGGDWRRTGVAASTFTATLVQADADRLVLDGYGSPGMSGSPVLNGRGEIVGLVFGGARDSGGRLVYAVPGAALQAMLEAGAR